MTISTEEGKSHSYMILLYLQSAKIAANVHIVFIQHFTDLYLKLSIRRNFKEIFPKAGMHQY